MKRKTIMVMVKQNQRKTMVLTKQVYHKKYAGRKSLRRRKGEQKR